MGLLEEDASFEESHAGVDFPVGWTEFNLGGVFSPQVRMVYPAMFDGEDKDMAGNGPFSWLIFIGDSGESVDSYTLFTEELAKRGFIVVVTQPLSDETDVEETLERFTDIHAAMVQQNQSNVHVLGTVGNIDVSHWGVSGHGKGAAAAYLAFPFWNQTGLASAEQPPRGLFGLGLDLEDLDEDFEWSDVATPEFPQPNTGLFITGTVDEVAPSQETMERVDEHGGIAWQWMHLLGANHYQFQDSQSFLENDGDATMSQTAQIDLASEHVIAYLDTVLHGDHSRFREAFNRAEGPQTVSDPNAYVDEQLMAATFLPWTSQTISHNASETLNATHTFVISLNWTLRDGTTFPELPAGWDVNLTCGWTNGPWETEAIIASNGTVSCHYPMAPVAPGLQTAWLKLQVEGAPSMYTASVFRENTPIEVLSPKPVIYVPQHSSRTLNASNIAIDPDGQPVRIVEATLIGDDASHFLIEIGQDGLDMTVSHALNEEWLGECVAEVTLRSDGLTVDEATTQLSVVMTPVNDPPIKSGTVPIQEMDEDGTSVVFDLGDVVSDPEGVPLELDIAGEKNGEQGPILFSIEGERITLTPLLNAHGATVLQILASDGENPSVLVEMAVVVNPVNDPVVVNASAWTNLSMVEDTPFTLALSPLAYDVDGDPLTWTLEGNLDVLSVSLVNNSFELVPANDAFGIYQGLWLNVSDGSTTHSENLSLTIAAVGDLPFVAIESVQGMSGSTANMYWSVADVDGSVNTEASVSVDGTVVEVSHSCLSSSNGVYQCVTLLPFSPGSATSVYIELEVYDDELERSVIASKVFDPLSDNSSNNQQSESEEDDAEGALTLIVGAGGFVLVLLAGAAFVFFRSRGEDDVESSLASQRAVEPSTQESTQGSGLLARAERLK
tara:strand:- start:3455 stop:6142 length:2688 start_codon:yes stop_codon:yes gene_type:complete